MILICKMYYAEKKTNLFYKLKQKKLLMHLESTIFLNAAKLTICTFACTVQNLTKTITKSLIKKKWCFVWFVYFKIFT